MRKSPVKSALLEIGVEELPARFIKPALEQLNASVSKELQSIGLGCKAIEVFGTPRRLTVLLSGLDPQAADREDVVIGPPPKAAKDDKDQWTKAALGFAKSQHMSVNKLVLQSTPKGDRYVASHHLKGQKTDVILKKLFPSVIKQLTFPKSMVWEKEGFRFARPIRWIVALYNSKVVRFSLAGINSDRSTVGLMALGGHKIRIPKPEKYRSLLQGRCIVIDPMDRQKKIVNQMEVLAKKSKAKPIVDPTHLDEVVNLTEFPTSILGHFPEAYLEIPKEILVSVLKKHQKFFPLENNKKQLINAFIGVRNGPTEAQDVVRDGYERVLNARLADAQFFFQQDSQIPLDTFASRLTEVGFHQKLGNLKDKSERIQKLVRKWGDRLGLDSSLIDKAERVAKLSKADLLTQIVGEFPELQGQAGRFYSLKQKEDEDIAKAIEENYWPLVNDGDLPTSDMSALAALADKMDTLAGNFYVDQAPTGSADPYGLRRSSTGVIRICIDRGWMIPLQDLIEDVFLFPDWYKEDVEKRKNELRDFFQQRCLNWFSAEGFRVDEIEAVLSQQKDSLVVLLEKLKGMKAVRGRPEFSSLAAAIKRARNILKQAQSKGFLPKADSMTQQNDWGEAERQLWDAISGAKPRFQEALAKRQFESALLELAPLKQPVDAFFEGVMVMVDDEKVRSQRLRLLMTIEDLFRSMADFSKLQSSAGEN